MPVVELRDGLCAQNADEAGKSPCDLTDQQIVDEVNSHDKTGMYSLGFTEVQLAKVLGRRIMSILNGHCMGPITVANIVTNYLKLSNGDIAVHRALEKMVADHKLAEMPGKPDSYIIVRTR
jgi:hypothetical protein